MKNGFQFPALSTLVVVCLAMMSCNKEELSPVSQSVPDTIEARSSAVTGAVYVMDNDVTENKVLTFTRRSDGTLSEGPAYATGGAGTGGGLGSQGALVLYKQFLFVTNPGSDEVSVFDTRGQQFTLADVAYSGGQMPISLTVHKDILYVLNAGGGGNIAGFRVDNRGSLSFISGSEQPLSNNAAGPAQISFAPDGNYLVTTEKATNLIGVYGVDGSGVAGPPTFYPSAGATPFGFEFGHRGQLFVSEAFGGSPGASAVSSYSLSSSGNLELISGSVGTGQTAACWVAISNNGRYGYTTNTGSGSVTGYGINSAGELTRLDASGATGNSGAGPIDMAFSRNSSYLYTLNAGDDSITIFEVGNDGTLISLGDLPGLPDGAAGMAAE